MVEDDAVNHRVARKNMQDNVNAGAQSIESLAAVLKVILGLDGTWALDASPKKGRIYRTLWAASAECPGQ